MNRTQLTTTWGIQRPMKQRIHKYAGYPSQGLGYLRNKGEHACDQKDVLS